MQESANWRRPLRNGTAQEKAHEFADVLAWLATLANIAGVDLETRWLQVRQWLPGCGKSPLRVPCGKTLIYVSRRRLPMRFLVPLCLVAWCIPSRRAPNRLTGLRKSRKFRSVPGLSTGRPNAYKVGCDAGLRRIVRRRRRVEAKAGAELLFANRNGRQRRRRTRIRVPVSLKPFATTPSSATSKPDAWGGPATKSASAARQRPRLFASRPLAFLTPTSTPSLSDARSKLTDLH